MLRPPSGGPHNASYAVMPPFDLPFKSALLCDIGKVCIPDIRRKPGKLTPDEFEIMKAHTTIGRDTIAAAERRPPPATC